MDITNSIPLLNHHYLNIYKFFLKLTNEVKHSGSNYLSMWSVYDALNYVIEGMNEESKATMDPVLKQLITASAVSPPSSLRFPQRFGVFINPRYNFNANYVEKFKKEFIFSFIPSDSTTMENVNAIIKPTLRMNEMFFDEPFSPKINVLIKNEIFFKNLWHYPFRAEDTEERLFCVDKKTNTFTGLKTMTQDQQNNHFFTYSDEEKKCDYISLRYEQNEDCMLIIMPRKIMNKKELINFCLEEISGDDITNFYSRRKLTRIQTLDMPKFKIKTFWNFTLDDLSETLVRDFCPYLKFLNDAYETPTKSRFEKAFSLINPKNEIPKLALPGLFCNDDDDNNKVCVDTISISLKTVFNNTESGTYESKKALPKTMRKSQIEGETFIMNSSFLFAIVDKHGKILSMGLYSGDEGKPKKVNVKTMAL